MQVVFGTREKAPQEINTRGSQLLGILMYVCLNVHFIIFSNTCGSLNAWFNSIFFSASSGQHESKGFDWMFSFL